MFFPETRWTPAQDFQRLQQEVDRLFSGVSGAVHSFPPVNLWTSENDVTVTAELPGVNTEDIDIAVHGDSLVLRAARKPVEINENDTLYRHERIHGEFSKTVQLPFKVDGDKVSASYKRGVLSVTCPRAEEDKPRKIQIKAA
jgi:HSP20 family protein